MNPKSNNWLLWLSLAVVVIIIIVALIIHFARGTSPTTIPSPSSSATATVTPTGSLVTEALQSRSRLQIPAIDASATIALAALPADLRDLVPSDAAGAEAQGVTYAGGKTGFEINYASSDALLDSFNNFVDGTLHQNWMLTMASRSVLAGVIQAEDATYTIQIEQMYSGSQPTGNVATVIEAIHN